MDEPQKHAELWKEGTTCEYGIVTLTIVSTWLDAGQGFRGAPPCPLGSDGTAGVVPQFTDETAAIGDFRKAKWPESRGLGISAQVFWGQFHLTFCSKRTAFASLNFSSWWAEHKPRKAGDLDRIPGKCSSAWERDWASAVTVLRTFQFLKVE